MRLTPLGNVIVISLIIVISMATVIVCAFQIRKIQLHEQFIKEHPLNLDYEEMIENFEPPEYMNITTECTTSCTTTDYPK